MKKKRIEYISVTAMALEFIVMALVAWFTIHSILSSVSRDYARSLVSQTKQSINEEMSKPIVIGQTLASYPDFISALENEDRISEKEFVSLVSRELRVLEDNLGEKYAIYLISDKSRRYVTSEGLNKIVDVENDEHDVWYSIFLASKGKYSMDIDVDQSRNNAWTAFVNCRIYDSKGNFLGCLAIAYDMSNVQTLFKELERTYSCDISVYDATRNLMVDIENVSKDEAYYDIGNKTTSSEDTFTMTKSGFSTVTYLESLGWWIVIEDDNMTYLNSYARLVLYLFLILCVIAVVMVFGTSRVMKKEAGIVAKDAQVEGIGTLASIYYTMHLINLETGEFVSLKTGKGYENMEEYHGGKDARNAIVRIMKMGFGSSGTDFSKIEEFCNLDSLEKRLENQTDISREFVSNHGHWFRARFIPKDYDKNGKLLSVIYAIENIDKQKKYEAHLKELSQIDKLTGITNRGHGEMLIEEMFLKKQSGTMIILDGDHFKNINDTFGHDAGDEVIVNIAHTLKGSLSENDIVMRLGGDEFAAYIVGLYTEEDVKPVIDNFIHEVETLRLPKIREKKIEISIGATMYAGIARTNFETMYKKTDKLLYESKLVKGSYCTYDTYVQSENK